MQFISQHDPEAFSSTALWARIRVAVAAVEHDAGAGRFPYDVACNLLRPVDDTRMHLDNEPDEDEWTFLLCVAAGEAAMVLDCVLAVRGTVLRCCGAFH